MGVGKTVAGSLSLFLTICQDEKRAKPNHVYRPSFWVTNRDLVIQSVGDMDRAFRGLLDIYVITSTPNSRATYPSGVKIIKNSQEWLSLATTLHNKRSEARVSIPLI